MISVLTSVAASTMLQRCIAEISEHLARSHDRGCRKPGNATPKTSFQDVLVPREYIEKLEPQPRAYVLAVAEGVAEALGRKVTHVSLAEAWDNDRPSGDGHDHIETWLEEGGSYSTITTCLTNMSL